MRVSLIAVGSLALLAGCSAGPATRSGFLANYGSMAPAKGNESLLQQAPPAGFDAGRYDAVFVERPVIMVDGLKPQDAEELSTVFADALKKQLGAGRRIVDRVGPNTLRVRAAITKTNKASVPVNVVTSLIAMPVMRGGVAAEAEILDGGNGKRIAAMSWSRRGGKIYEPGLSYTRLGHARAGLRAFADKVADLVAPRA